MGDQICILHPPHGLFTQILAWSLSIVRTLTGSPEIIGFGWSDAAAGGLESNTHAAAH